MLGSIAREIRLSIQARNGLSAGVLIWTAVIAVATFTAFVFLCVAAYAWLSVVFNPVYAGLIMAGGFILIALVAAAVSAMIRRQVRQQAILARAAKAHAPSSWLLDPKMLGVAVEAGRSIGWQRIVPVALLGFVVAQWAREYRAHPPDQRQS